MLNLKTLLVFSNLSERQKFYIINKLKEKNIKCFKDTFPNQYNYCIRNMSYYQNNEFCSIR